MRARFMRSCFALSRAIQLTGGAITTLLTLGIYVYILVLDSSLPTAQRPVDRSDVFTFLILVLPAALVGAGSYLQVIRGKLWAFALVAIAGLGNFLFVGINIGFLFAYIGDRWGQGAVLADLIAVSLTVGAVFANLVLLAKPERAWTIEARRNANRKSVTVR